MYRKENTKIQPHTRWSFRASARNVKIPSVLHTSTGLSRRLFTLTSAITSNWWWQNHWRYAPRHRRLPPCTQLKGHDSTRLHLTQQSRLHTTQQSRLHSTGCTHDTALYNNSNAKLQLYTFVLTIIKNIIISNHYNYNYPLYTHNLMTITSPSPIVSFTNTITACYS